MTSAARITRLTDPTIELTSNSPGDTVALRELADDRQGRKRVLNTKRRSSLELDDEPEHMLLDDVCVRPNL